MTLLDGPVTKEDVEENWDDGPKANLCWMALAMQYPHEREHFARKAIVNSLAGEMLPMWAIKDIAIVDMSLQQVLLTLEGILWLGLCTLYPTTRSEQWFAQYDAIVEALRTRAYHLVAHAPISSFILNIADDYTEPYTVAAGEKRVHLRGVVDEDYYSDAERKEKAKRARLQQEEGVIDWTQFTTPTAEGAATEEGSLAQTGTVETQRKATMALVHDFRWMFHDLDEARERSRIASEKGPSYDLRALRQFFVEQFQGVEANTLRSRAQWQDQLQCLPSFRAIYRRQKKRQRVSVQEVIVNKLHRLLHLDVPKTVSDMFLPVSKDHDTNARWLQRNTDFMFQHHSHTSMEKGDLYTYLTDRNVIERIALTGKWLLHLEGKPTLWFDSFTHAFAHMRHEQKGMDPIVYLFGAEQYRLPKTIDLSQYDVFLWGPSPTEK
jgi:hypothetical protein